MKKEDFLKIVKDNDYLLVKNRFRRELDGEGCSFKDLANLAKGEHTLVCGYFFWPEDEEPSKLGPAFTDSKGDSWAYFSISDNSVPEWEGSEELLSIVELHEKNKENARTSKFSYPQEVLKKLEGDKKDAYWHVYVGETLCGRSDLTEEEIQTLSNLMTPFEKMLYERKAASVICEDGYMNPLLQSSKENPFSFYIAGNDDASWTMNGDLNEKPFMTAAKRGFHLPGSFVNDVFYFLSSPNWYLIEKSYNTRWYFSN